MTYHRRDGFQMSEESEIWISYERRSSKRNCTGAPTSSPGSSPRTPRRPDGEWIRLVLEQLGGLKAPSKS